MNKPGQSGQQSARLILEEMEQRRLFSGGIEGLVNFEDDHQSLAVYRDLDEGAVEESTEAQAEAEHIRREIAFVDTAVEGYQQLVDDILANTDQDRQIEVVILDNERDGVAQISATLARYQDIDAVHIISHGDDGSVQLGNSSLDADSLQENKMSIAMWANAFADEGDILIYGCNLAATGAGQSLIGDLGALTLTDVAASTDLTGHASLGGDWQLELNVGTIEAEVAISAQAQAQWSVVLAATADDEFDYPAGNLAGNGGGSGWTGAWSGGASNFQVTGTSLNHPGGGLQTSGGAIELNAPGFTIPAMTARDLSSSLGAVDETVWASFLLQPDETSDPGNSYMGLTFGTGGMGNTNQLFVGYSGTDFKMNNWGGGGLNIDVPGAVSGETVFLVVRLDFSSTGNDTATLYVNPTAGLLNPDTAASPSKADLDLGTFSTISIAGGRDGPSNASLLDQVRIGSSYLDVAPLPAAPPEITSDGGGPTASLNVAENSTAVTTVAATDANLDTITYSISGGADQALFSIDANSGELVFVTAPDYEGPGDNSYEVQVTADDGNGGTDVQTITVAVTDVNDPATAVDDGFSVGEDATLDSSSAWFDSDWLYRRTLSFNNLGNAENLVDFTVLIKLDSTRIDYGKTHDQGDDLRFFDQNGNALAHEIETWNEAGDSFVWVKVPQIDANSSQNSVVMYYGNAGVSDDGQDPAGVWADNSAVYHLNENPAPSAPISDSAGNYDATNSGSTDTAGVIGGAQDFNGADQHINLGDNRDWINNATASTLSIWMNADSVSGSGDLIGLSRNDPADTGASRITLIRNGDNIQMIGRTMDDSSDSVSVTTSSSPLTANQWHHITGSIDYASDVDNIRIYVDGVLEGTFSHDFTNNAIPNTDSSHAVIGADEDGVSAFFDGQLDEARIASTLRSAGWVAAQYASMTDNFVTVGAEHTSHGVLANDIDLESDTLSVTAMNGAPAAVGVATLLPSGAILTLNADGSFIYDTNGAFESLDVGESTTDSFTYEVDDGVGGSDTGSVTITIVGAEDAAVVGGVTTGTVAEEGTQTASGALTITDTDTSDNPVSFPDVAATAGDNGYGDFEMTGNSWTYTLNNSHAAVQALDAGESLTDTYTFTASDGSTQTVTVTIDGAEDTAVPGGSTTGTVAEDGAATASGALTITDTDTSDNPVSFPDVAATAGDNGYGDFEMTGNSWTYTLNNSHAAVQALDAGESLTDTYTFTASDGSTQTVTVTIDGAEDTAVLGGSTTGTVAEDGAATASGALTITDTDTSDNPVSFPDVAATAGDNGYGDFEMTGNSWTYTLNNSHAAVQALDAGESLTDTYTFTASDGSTQTVTVTIDGAEDTAVPGGTTTGTVAEDGAATASGALTITDADSSDNPVSFPDVAATAGDNGYGDFEMTGNSWTYTLNNNHAAVQALDAGETLTDNYTFTASDGSTQTITVNIDGAEDTAVLGGTTTGTVAEDGAATASGALTITDTDTSDNPVSFPDVAATAGDNGYGDFEMTGNSWTYTLNNSHAAVQALDAGESLTDTCTFTASDGSTQTVTVTIDGAEDAPVPGGTTTGTVAEDGAATASGALTITDADSSDNPVSFPDVAATAGDNGYGDFEMTGNSWTFTLNNTHAAVQALDVGESLTDTCTFTASDGSTQTVTVTIDGAEDAPVISGDSSGHVIEDRVTGDSWLIESGKLDITDLDLGDAEFVEGTSQGTYGELTIDAEGNWRYVADNSQVVIQALRVGETLVDTIEVLTADGSRHQLALRIAGSDEFEPVQGVLTVAAEEAAIETELPRENIISAGDKSQNLETEIEAEIFNPSVGVRAQPGPEPGKTPVEKTMLRQSAERVADAPVAPAPNPAARTPALDIDALTLQVEDDETINELFERQLLEQIDLLQDSMEQAADKQSADDVEVEVVIGSTVSMTAGFVAWILRGGSLLASLMSAVPVLNRFDPLPIVKKSRSETVDEEDDDTQGTTRERQHRVDRMFDVED